MPVEGINASESARVDQVRNEQRAEDVRIQEQKRQDDNSTEIRRVTEQGRGDNMDVTV